MEAHRTSNSDDIVRYLKETLGLTLFIVYYRMNYKQIIYGGIMNNHLVYWYHLKEHNDPYKEGYIGVTKNLAKRNYEHFRENKTQYHFHKAIKKYGKENIILKVLHENLSKTEAYALERQYRSSNGIGWNYNSGGKVLCDITFHSIVMFHKDTPHIELKFNSITEASEQLNINRLRISTALQRKTNAYGRDGWHVVHESTNKETILSNSKQMSKTIKGRKINMKYHPRWKAVSLWHINEPTKIYTFDNISKAASTLNISRSSLEHKIYRRQTTSTKEGWCIKHVGSQDLFNEQVKT